MLWFWGIVTPVGRTGLGPQREDWEGRVSHAMTPKEIGGFLYVGGLWPISTIDLRGGMEGRQPPGKGIWGAATP